jgi:hypothetical protein
VISDPKLPHHKSSSRRRQSNDWLAADRRETMKTTGVIFMVGAILIFGAWLILGGVNW